MSNNDYSNSYCDTLNGGVPKSEMGTVCIGAKASDGLELPLPGRKQPVNNDPIDFMFLVCPGPDGKYAFEPITRASINNDWPTVIKG